MANVVTSKYKTDSVKLFIDSLSTNEYYLFVSSADRTTALNSSVSKTDFLERTIFGKEVEDVYYMIKNNVWQPGVVFDQYDDTADLSDKKFYAVVYPQSDDSGVYRVFKCIYNSNGSTTIAPPNFSTTSTDQVYQTGDGYIWKYMYSMTELEFEKYNALGYLPILPENVYTTTPVEESQIDQIFVENPFSNQGYDYINGTVDSLQEGAGNIEKVFIKPSADTPLEAFQNYYSNQSLFVTSGLGSTLYVIDTYLYDSNTGLGIVTLKNSPPLTNIITDPNVFFQIFPQIKIEGDGSGAEAIPVIVNSTIERIQMNKKGVGYTNAKATVVQPFGLDPLADDSTDETAVLRPILSPKGGHGTNTPEELKSSRCLLYTGISATDNLTIPTTNQFSKVGIVRNPEFSGDSANTAIDVFDNRIRLEVDTTAGLVVDGVLTQSTGGEKTFEGRIHEIAPNNVIYISEYNGPYQNYTGTDTPLNPDLPLIASQGQLVNINKENGEPQITYSSYVQKTGDVYYMNDFRPIERISDSQEQFKIILEF